MVDHHQAGQVRPPVADHHRVGDVRTEFELVFDLGGRDVLAAGRDHDVALAVAEPQRAIGVQRADVAGVEPAVPQRLGRLFGPVAVARKYARPADQDFAIRRDAQLGAAHRAANAVQRNRPGRVDRCHAGAFGLPVHLDHVDAEPEVPTDHLRRYRRGAAADQAAAAKAQHAPGIAQRGPVGDAPQHAQRQWHRAPLQAPLRYRRADPRGLPVNPALQTRRIRKRHGSGRIQLLPDARNGDEHGRLHLAQVFQHGIGALGEIDDALECQRPQRRHHALRHMAQGQESQRLIVRAGRGNALPGPDLVRQVAVGQARSLWRPGGAGGVHQDRVVRRPRQRAGPDPSIGIGAVALCPQRTQGVETHHGGVLEVLQSFQLDHDDLVQPRQPRQAPQHLVQLLIVLDHHHPRLAVAQDVFDLLARRSRIKPHGDGADTLHAHVGVQPFVPRLGQDGDAVPSGHAQRCKAQPDGGRAIAILGPRDALPDPVVLVHQCRASGAPRHRPREHLRHGAILPRRGKVYRHCFFRFQRRSPRTPTSPCPR